MLKKAWFILITLCFAQITFAQRDLIRFNNITIDNGLIQGSISGVVHGKDGFIWIATADGLHRYDGYNFKIYRNDPSQPNSLPDNYISCIYEDNSGKLLVGLYNGEVCILNKRSSEFKKLNLHRGKTKETPKPVTCISEDGRGAYLIGFDGAGMIKYDTSGTKIKIFQTGVTGGLVSNSIRCISKDRFTGNFWVGTATGLTEYNPVNDVFTTYPNFRNLNDKIITTILATQPDQLHIGTYGKGLYLYKRGEDTASRMVLPKSKGSRFISFLEYNTNNKELWIGTFGGLIRLSAVKATLYTNNPLNPESLVDNKTQTATFDRFGSLWIGTINGLSRFDQRLKLFNLYREFKWQDTLLNNNVYCIYEDPKQNLWLGTISSGILKFDPQTETLTAWPLIKTLGVETRSVRAIMCDHNGQMWLGSRDDGLFKFYPDQNKFIHVNGKKGFEISSPTIRAVFEDHEGTIWVGTANGLNRYDQKTDQFSVFRAYPQTPNQNNIYQISESPDGQLLYLACFRGGFQIFNKKTNSFKIYDIKSPDKKQNSTSYAMCFEFLTPDSVILGTYGGGLFIFSLKTGGLRNITEKNGLANNSIYGILKFQNTLWLSTNRGISKLNLKTGNIRNFGIKNYLQSNEYNEGAYCKTKSGTFYFGGVNGFNYFNPALFPTERDQSPTEITAIKKGELEVPVKTDAKGNHYIELSYNDNLISFEFAKLNFIPSQSNHYIYKIEGFDENWINAGTRTIAYYTKLSPGEYVFRVKSVSADSTDGAQSSTSIRIIIDPPFWQTWWFYSLLALLVLSIIYFIIKWRTQIIDRNYKHKLADLELKALRSQMNPHFIFNSLNSIQYFILKKEPKDAYNYLTKFSSLMRMILQNSKHKSITLQAEHDWLKTYLELENLRMENSLEFSINIDKNLQADKVYVPTMIFQPYVENAIIHGLLPKEGPRNINIEIRQVDQNLWCSITDNGIGRAQSKELNKSRLKHHESTAMNLTRDRLAILNIDAGEGLGPNIIDLFNENGEAAGTRVELVIPLIIQNE